jgi:outer membrane protein assembly factor BamB
VLALDQATGKLAWSVEATGCSPITGYDNTICFVDRTENGRLIAVSRDTGQPAWHVSGLNSCNAFVTIGRQGYLMTDDSEILALAFDL